MRSIIFAIGLTLAALGGWSAAAEPGANTNAASLKSKMDAAKRDADNDLRAKFELRAGTGTFKNDAALKLANIKSAAASLNDSAQSDLRAVSSAAKAKGAIGADAIKAAKSQGFKRSDIANAATSSQYRQDRSDKAAKQGGASNKLR